MTKEETKKKIKEVTDKIVKKYQPEKIILFGSHAWGKPDHDSDVDLFIVKESKERSLDRARRVRDIIWEVGIPIDILVYTPEEIKRRLWLKDFFIEDVIHKGKVLYQSS